MARLEYKDLANEDVDEKVKQLQQALLDLDKVVDELAKSFKPAKQSLDAFAKSTQAAVTAVKTGRETIKQNATTVAEMTQRQMQLSQATKEWKNLILQGADAAKIAEANNKRLTAAINAEDEATKRGAKSIAVLNRERVKNVKEIQKLTEATKQQTVTLKDEIGSYNALQKELKENVAAYKAMSAAERDTTKAGKQLTQTIRTKEAQLKKLDSAIGRSFRNVGNYRSALMGVNQSLLGIAAGMGVATSATLLIGTALKNAATSVVTFQKQNAVLAGVLGKTQVQVKTLTNDAIRWGSETAKTSSQITDLQISLARLGFTQEEILDLTQGLIQGSTALNANLDETAALVGAVVRTFDELSTTDAIEIVDKLTLATQKSALNFDRLQTALPIVAGAANAAGVSFDKVVALLGKLSDAGIDASMSATSLRNIFIDSAAQGLDFEQILTKIKNSQDKLTAANDEFGRRTAVSATVLSTQLDQLVEFEDAIKKAGGTAEEVANIQLNTLDGRLKLLTSAWDGLVKSIDQGEGTISRFVDDVLVDFAEILKDITALNADPFEEETAAIIKEVSENTLDLTTNLFFYEQRLIEARARLADFVQEHTNGERPINKQNKQYRELEATLNRYIRIVDAGNEAQEKLNASWDEGSTQGGKVVKTAAELNKEFKDMVKLLDELNFGNIESLFGGDLLKEKGSNIKISDIVDIQSFIDGNEVLQNLGKELLLFTDFTDLTRDIEEGGLTFIEKLQDFVTVNADEIKEAAIALASGIGDIFSSIADLRNAQIEQELQALEINRDAQIAAVEAELVSEERKAAEIAIINEKTAEKQAELNREKAQNDKKTAIFEAIIATAVGVAQALPNIFLAAVVGALGAVQIATIASTPIPAFEVGTKSAPEGPALVGEKGAELVVTPSGEIGLTPSTPTIVDLKGGSQVFTAQETKDILDQFSNGKNEFSREVIVNDSITPEQIKAAIAEGIANQTQHITQIGRRGLESFTKHKNNTSKYYSNRYN